MKLLSIIIPIHNAENYISDCLQSILNQGLNADDYEVILVNDGTKDRSMERIKNLLSENPNFNVYEQSCQGPSVARNTGLEHTVGDYVLMMDSDDILIDKSLPIILHNAIDSRCDIVAGDFLKLTSDKIPYYCPAPHQIVNTEKISGHNYLIQYQNPQQCYIWRNLYRREFLRKNNIRFTPGIGFGEDILFTIECLLHAEQCLKVDYPFYIYRQHQGSIVSSVNMKKLKHLNLVMAHLQEIKNNNHCPIDVDHKIDTNIFATFSITIWYLTHNKELLRQMDEYIADFKNKVHCLPLGKDVKQYAMSLMFRHLPKTYIRLRSLFR